MYFLLDSMPTNVSSTEPSRGADSKLLLCASTICQAGTCKCRESVLPRRPIAYRSASPLTRFPLSRWATTPFPSDVFSTLFTWDTEVEEQGKNVQ